MNLLSRQTALMYDHPLTVSNAVLRINTNIIKIHRSMKDVALAQDMADIEESSLLVDNHEKEIYKDFDIISKRFLGENEKYEKALKVFTEWKVIRDEVISLMRARKNVEAANITKGIGAIHVSRIEEAMESLGDFAQGKAEEFYNTSGVVKQKAFNMMYLLVAVSIVFGIVFTIVFTKSITNPLAIMRSATAKIGEGNLDTKIVVTNKDEIGELADEFNKMTTGLREVTASRDELDKEITERKQAEEELVRIFDLSIDMICVCDISNGCFKKINPAFGKTLGYSEEELLEKPFYDFIHPDDIDSTTNEVEEILATGKNVVDFENRYRCKDGSYKWLMWTAKLSLEHGITYAIAHDITERKKSEEQIKASLKEKEVLLKEIHHRVKNNMQIMASLLRLQSEGIKDKHLLGLFEESRNRIKSMALIHEDLYSGKDLGRIDFDQYTRTLTARLTKSYEVDPNRIITSVNIDNVFLGVDTAIPCGLMINELFTNSLKYAFPLDRFKDKKGEIRIDCHSNSAEHTLVFSDNGVGFPEDIDFQDPETMGLELVNTLVKQLGGTIELNRNSGTEFTITFEV